MKQLSAGMFTVENAPGMKNAVERIEERERERDGEVIEASRHDTQQQTQQWRRSSRSRKTRAISRQVYIDAFDWGKLIELRPCITNEPPVSGFALHLYILYKVRGGAVVYVFPPVSHQGDWRTDFPYIYSIYDIDLVSIEVDWIFELNRAYIGYYTVTGSSAKTLCWHLRAQHITEMSKLYI